MTYSGSPADPYFIPLTFGQLIQGQPRGTAEPGPVGRELGIEMRADSPLSRRQRINVQVLQVRMRRRYVDGLGAQEDGFLRVRQCRGNEEAGRQADAFPHGVEICCLSAETPGLKV